MSFRAKWPGGVRDFPQALQSITSDIIGDKWKIEPGEPPNCLNCTNCMYSATWNKLTTIGRGWAKYRDLLVASRSILFAKAWRPRQIILIWETDEKAICHFHTRAITRRRKAWFLLRMSRILLATKHSWTTLHMSRPLFVGSYLQVTLWALGQWKERIICFEW